MAVYKKQSIWLSSEEVRKWHEEQDAKRVEKLLNAKLEELGKKGGKRAGKKSEKGKPINPRKGQESWNLQQDQGWQDQDWQQQS